MSLIKESFDRLFPEKVLGKAVKLRYSGKFSNYNANVRITPLSLTFNLSRKWKPIDNEIKIGLVQTLLLKVYREKRATGNIDLYNSFVRNLHLSIPKTQSSPVLEESFSRVNENYFYGLIDAPNLAWSNAVSKLGSYDYHTDTIKISKIFMGEPELLDYVMYHEVLHKKIKFRNSGSRTYHHTAEFRKREREFPNSQEMERRIKGIIARKRVTSLFPSFLKKLF